ncbi:protein kinase, putative [Hepatocystis sp. ex Piliocolobus tephrosceles]|nr:protein kinase, putative [Hepatocystis sp. ex Piliocolobus tephrosceles]
MSFSYKFNEKSIKYFHEGYVLDSSKKIKNSDLYICTFLKKNEKRLVRKEKHILINGVTLCNLQSIRNFTYNINPTIPKYLLKVYNIYKDRDYAYVVMENCTGGFFWDMLADNNTLISEQKLAEWIYQILVTLVFLEYNQIYHGNVNGYCILFKDIEKKEIRLSLLSKSNIYDNIDEIGDLYGLYFIRSPQEIQQSNYDKNNAWYVGMLLYFILYGSFPFMNNNVLKSYSSIIRNDINLNSLKIKYNYLGDNIFNFIKCALEKNYNLRLSTKELIEHPWIKERSNHIEYNIIDKNTRKSAYNHIKMTEQNIIELLKKASSECKPIA